MEYHVGKCEQGGESGAPNRRKSTREIDVAISIIIAILKTLHWMWKTLPLTHIFSSLLSLGKINDFSIQDTRRLESCNNR